MTSIVYLNAERVLQRLIYRIETVESIELSVPRGLLTDPAPFLPIYHHNLRNVCSARSHVDKMLRQSLESLCDDTRKIKRNAVEIEGDVATILSDARTRISKGVAPGFADKGKAKNAEGDAVLWLQLLATAAEKSKENPRLLTLIFVTEDWVKKAHGKSVGALPELITEVAEKCGLRFELHSLSRFLKLTDATQDTIDAVSNASSRQREKLRRALARRLRMDDETSRPTFDETWPESFHVGDQVMVAEGEAEGAVGMVISVRPLGRSMVVMFDDEVKPMNTHSVVKVDR